MANSKQYILSLFPDNNNNEISAADIRQFVNAIFDEEVDTTAIIDNLFSSDAKVPLSANQGRLLDAKIALNIIEIDKKEPELGVGSINQVLTIDTNQNKIWKTPVSYEQVLVEDVLTSVSSTHALSANQGRILNSKIADNSGYIISNKSLIDSNITNIANLTTTVAKNIGDILINSDDIIINKTNILTNINNINVNTNNILNIVNNELPRIEGDITDTNSRVSINETDISVLENRVTANEDGIVILDSRVTINEINILALQGQVGSINLDDLTDRVFVNEQNILINTNDIASNLTLIQANQTNISINSSNISSMGSQISSNSSSIQINQTKIDQNTGNINTNIQEISNIKLRVTINEDSLITNSAKILANENSIQDNVIRINNNSTRITTNSTDIFNNKQDIEVLKVESIQHFTDIEKNRIKIQENLNNFFNIESQVTSNSTLISALNVDVNGSDSVDPQDPNFGKNGKEDWLGIPTDDDFILKSDQNGTRRWAKNISVTPFSVLDTLFEGNPGDFIIPSEWNGNSFDAASVNSIFQLDQKVDTKEDYLGVAPLDGMILAGFQDGSRDWVQANILSIDYGFFFGGGYTLNRIVIEYASGIINNQEENAKRVLKCIGTFTHLTNPTQSVDISEKCTWENTETDPNIDAFIITNGINGGTLTCSTQTFTNGQNFLLTESNAAEVKASFTYNGITQTAIATIEIDNGSIVKTLRLEPSAQVNLVVLQTQQFEAIASYTHNNWQALGTNVTTDSNTTWSSGNLAVLNPTGQPGEFQAISTGVTLANANNNGIDAQTSVSVTT